MIDMTEPVAHTGGQAPTAPARPLRSPARRALYPDAPSISVHAEGQEDRAEAVGRVCALAGTGAVYQVKLRQPGRRRRALALRDAHVRSGGDVQDVMFDAASYAGKNRTVGPGRLDPGWVDDQLRLGVRFALTDSPYIPSRSDGGDAALESILSQTRQMKRPAVAVLPIHISWLKVHSAELLDAVNRAVVPVALVLEHTGDPLGTSAAVKGLMHVVSADVPVVLLRTDLSAIGAVAWGASMGAIGTRSGLRHLFPVREKSGGRPTNVSLYVPSCLSYRTLSTLGDAVERMPDDQLWFDCDCAQCFGRQLTWVQSDEEAYSHTIKAAVETARQILTPDLSAAEQRESWRQKCLHAQEINFLIESKLDGGWPQRDFHGAWIQSSSTPI